MRRTSIWRSERKLCLGKTLPDCAGQPRAPWVGEEPPSDGTGAGADRDARAADALHQVLASDAGSVGGETGLAAQS